MFLTHWQYPIKETEEDETSAWTGIKFCIFVCESSYFCESVVYFFVSNLMSVLGNLEFCIKN